MKKLILIITMIFTLGTSLSFADKARFYENGKVIDTMYVDSPEGLRVRDNPSLKSNRICGLTHRLPVKVVAIGKEETIDGITAPWVEILIPKEEWKSNEPEYGWIFGGYIKKEQPKFIAPRNAAELWQYLTSVGKFEEYENDVNNYYIFGFGNEGNFWHGKDESGIGEGGNWKAVSKNKVQFHTSYVMEFEEDYSWELTFVFEDDGSFHYKAAESTNYCYPSFDQTGNLYYTSKSKGNYITYYANIDFWSEYNTRTIDQIVYDFIQWGLSADGTRFEQMYHDYWDPIMAEHQKKADAMK